MENEIRNEKGLEAGPPKSKSDRLSTIFWGCIILWAGLVFLADSLGLFLPLRGLPEAFPARDLGQLDPAWSLVFLGSGIVFLIASLVRRLAPAYRRPVGGNLVIGMICLGIGIGDLFHWAYIWPILLLLLGISFLASGIFKPRS